MFGIRLGLTRTTKLLVVLLIVAGVVIWRFPHYRRVALVVIGLLVVAFVVKVVANWRANQRVTSANTTLITPVRGVRRVIYDRTDQTRSHIGGAHTQLLIPREVIVTAPIHRLAQTVGTEGPKGGATKSSTTTLTAGAHNMVSGRGTLLLEATLAGSLPQNMGQTNFKFSSRTLWESMTTEAQSRSIRTQSELLLPTMTVGTFRKHCFQTDTGVDILFAAYEEDNNNADGTFAAAWFTPERFQAVHAEGTTHYGRIFLDTGNEATPLKRGALSVCDVFMATTTTDEAKVVQTLQANQRRLQHFNKPILTVVVNEEGAPMSRVLKVMLQFAEFGPVRYVERVRIVKQTGRTQFYPLPLSAQEQFIGIDEALTELLEGKTPSLYPSGREFRGLRTGLRSVDKGQTAAMAETKSELGVVESISADAETDLEPELPTPPVNPSRDQSKPSKLKRFSKPLSRNDKAPRAQRRATTPHEPAEDYAVDASHQADVPTFASVPPAGYGAPAAPANNYGGWAPAPNGAAPYTGVGSSPYGDPAPSYGPPLNGWQPPATTQPGSSPWVPAPNSSPNGNGAPMAWQGIPATEISADDNESVTGEIPIISQDDDLALTRENLSAVSVPVLASRGAHAVHNEKEVTIQSDKIVQAGLEEPKTLRELVIDELSTLEGRLPVMSAVKQYEADVSKLNEQEGNLAIDHDGETLYTKSQLIWPVRAK